MPIATAAKAVPLVITSAGLDWRALKGSWTAGLFELAMSQPLECAELIKKKPTDFDVPGCGQLAHFKRCGFNGSGNGTLQYQCKACNKKVSPSTLTFADDTVFMTAWQLAFGELDEWHDQVVSLIISRRDNPPPNLTILMEVLAENGLWCTTTNAPISLDTDKVVREAEMTSPKHQPLHQPPMKASQQQPPMTQPHPMTTSQPPQQPPMHTRMTSQPPPSQLEVIQPSSDDDLTFQVKRMIDKHNGSDELTKTMNLLLAKILELETKLIKANNRIRQMEEPVARPNDFSISGKKTYAATVRTRADFVRTLPHDDPRLTKHREMIKDEVEPDAIDAVARSRLILAKGDFNKRSDDLGCILVYGLARMPYSALREHMKVIGINTKQVFGMFWRESALEMVCPSRKVSDFVALLQGLGKVTCFPKLNLPRYMKELHSRLPASQVEAVVTRDLLRWKELSRDRMVNYVSVRIEEFKVALEDFNKSKKNDALPNGWVTVTKKKSASAVSDKRRGKAKASDEGTHEHQPPTINHPPPSNEELQVIMQTRKGQLPPNNNHLQASTKAQQPSSSNQSSNSHQPLPPPANDPTPPALATLPPVLTFVGRSDQKSDNFTIPTTPASKLNPPPTPTMPPFIIPHPPTTLQLPLSTPMKGSKRTPDFTPVQAKHQRRLPTDADPDDCPTHQDDNL
jgi:hypothetical protein